MSLHPTRSDQSDPTTTSPVTGFDQLHAGLQQQQDQQQQKLVLQQEGEEGGLSMQYPQHGHYRQQVGPDLPQSSRRIQPHPNTSTPFTQTHNSYVYPQAPSSSLPQSAHSSEETPEDDHDMKRMRVSRACDGCRRKKIKCTTDGLGSTCRSCNSANTVCTFKDSAKKRGPPKGYIEVLENRLKRMEQLIGGLAENKATTAATNQSHNNEAVTTDGGLTALSPSPSSPSLSPPPPPPLPPSTSPQTPNSAPLLSSTNDLPTLVASSNSVMAKLTPPGGTNSEPRTIFGTPTTTTTNNTMANAHFGKTRRPSIAEIHPRYIADLTTLPFLAQKFDVEDDRFAGSAGVKIRRFGRSLVLYEEGDATTGRTPNQFLLEKLGLLKPDEAILDVDDWISKVAGITKGTSDRLMKVYFAYIHPGLPVVNKTLFLNQYRGMADDYPSAPLLNAMYGAATRYIETCRLYGDETTIIDALDTEMDNLQIPEGGSEKLFDNLLKFVRGHYYPHIATIQALVIAQNHRASMEGKMTGGWLISSAAIRMAQDLGLHRSSEVWNISDDEKETRRRVWWAVYIMDKWSAASTGRPQTIFDEDCDESYPSESARWEEVLDIGYDARHDDRHQPRFPSLDRSIAQKAKGERIPIYQPFVQLIKLSEILGRILQGLYTPRAKKHSAEHGSDAIVSYLDKALSDWRAALPPSLQISGTRFQRLDSRGRTPLLSMSGLMYLSYCTLLILLHRPFIEKEGVEPTKSSVSSLSICTSAATRCVDVAASMHFRDFLLVSWNFAIYQVFTASLIHIHTAANSGSVISDVAKGDLIKSVSVVKRLSKFSTSAGQIHQVLLRLMKMGNIPYESLSDEEENGDKGATVSKAHINKGSRKRRKSKATPALTTPSAASNSDNYSSRSTNVDDSVDSARGDCKLTTSSTPWITDLSQNHSASKLLKSPNTSTQATSTSTRTPNQQYDDPSSSANSTPTSVVNGDWINGLYSSIQQDASITGINPHLETDPHSLRQFGMDFEQMFTPINQVSTLAASSNTMTLDQQHQYSLTVDNLSQNVLFGLTNVGFTRNNMQGQQPFEPIPYPGPNLMPPAQSSSSSSPPSSASLVHQEQQPPQPSSHANNHMLHIPAPSHTVPSHPSMVDHSLFKNRPGNPFWAVPSSIELDDWAAYLLPTNNDISGDSRNHPEGQHSTQPQYQQPQQQQTWPSGWI